MSSSQRSLWKPEQNRGGSALFMAHLCDLLGKGRIITVDKKKYPGQPQHPRISYLVGSSIDEILWPR